MRHGKILQVKVKAFSTLGNIGFKPRAIHSDGIWITLDTPFLIDGKLYKLKLEEQLHDNSLEFERYEEQ